MADEEDYSQFDVNISGKEYRTVAGRLKEFLDKKEKNKWQVFKFPEWLILGDNPVCRYHICVLDKDGKFLWYSAGTAGAYDKTMIDKSNPYENAETSAMGRALASEGYGLLSSIASAEEVTDAKKRQPTTTSNTPKPTTDTKRTPGGASDASYTFAKRLFVQLGKAKSAVKGESEEEKQDRRDQNKLAVCEYLTEKEYEIGESEDPLFDLFDQSKVSQVIDLLKSEIAEKAKAKK